MTAADLETIELSGGIIDLSQRAKYLLTGDDRVRYLNGQVTNDVRKADTRKTLQACITNVKGRIEGLVYYHQSQTGEAGLWLDAEPDQREFLAMRLDRYIIADDVVLSDVTDDWRLYHVFGTAADSWKDKVGSEGVLESTRYGQPGVDIWIPTTSPALNTDGTLLTEEAAESLRVLNHIPRWPEELNNEAFPQEAGLEATTMDFHKGCYIGQEILSRIKTSGKMPRQLVAVESTQPVESLPVQDGLRLGLSNEEAQIKDLGPVTSLKIHPITRHLIGMAYIRHGITLEHSLLLSGEDPPRITAEVRIIPL